MTNYELYQKLKDLSGCSKVSILHDGKYFQIKELVVEDKKDLVLIMEDECSRKLGKEYTIAQLKVGDVIRFPHTTANCPFMHMKVVEIVGTTVRALRPFFNLYSHELKAEEVLFDIGSPHKYVLIYQEVNNEE